MLTMQIVASGAWCHPNCAGWIQMVQISTANKGTTVLSKDKSRWEIFLLNIKSRHKYSSNWVKNSHTGKMGILHYFCHKEINLTKANRSFRVSVTKKRSLSKEFANCFEESWQSAMLRLQGFILQGLFWKQTQPRMHFSLLEGAEYLSSEAIVQEMITTLTHQNDWC